MNIGNMITEIIAIDSIINRARIRITNKLKMFTKRAKITFSMFSGRMNQKVDKFWNDRLS
ncbi:hypothetical protein GCM10023091_36370 [Ravibacter arvi]|uniref:Uncharacterized protein n=1 Tax=Ravibacter arvi TaxID=2051041 RepID=A0ABP8M896_9BACT